uniref:hypothetical protein n=1 Tax=Phaeostrophion irregulare TaxID=243268 RepID=UPI002E7AA788|nr:hypothetical protein V2492_pgp084 [Phaeostrophion irregulare]WAM64302.1 hypothetical protein [Phaeostrophion irregulare]
MNYFETIPTKLVFPINVMTATTHTINDETRFISTLQVKESIISSSNPILDVYTEVSHFMDKNHTLDYRKYKELMDIYDNYAKSQKIRDINALNDIKIFFIVKPIIKKTETHDEKRFISVVQIEEAVDSFSTGLGLLSINNYESLSANPASRIFLARDIFFQHKAEESYGKLTAFESRPGNRPYFLDESIATETPDKGIITNKLEDLDVDDEPVLEQESDYDNEMECGRFRDSGFTKNPRRHFLNRFIIEPEHDWIQVVWSLDLFDDEPYEYDTADIDTASFANPQNFFPKTDKIKGKNIIPMFASLEDAEKMLLTAVEDSLEPYKKKPVFFNFDELATLEAGDREFSQDNEEFPSKNYTLTIDQRDHYDPLNVDYLDESVTYAYRTYKHVPNGGMPETELEKTQNLLAETRKIKPTTNHKNHYYDSYDLHNDLFQREYEFKKELMLPKQKGMLLKTVVNTRIIEMGLGDFLELWNNTETKNAEILFLPSSDRARNLKSRFSRRPFPHSFYEYQKDFQKRHKRTKRKKSSCHYNIKSAVETSPPEEISIFI